MSEEKVRSILKIARQPVSLETPVGDDADAALGDMIEDVSASSPAEAAIHANLRAAIDEALDALSPRDAKVLRMRYGLDMKSSQLKDASITVFAARALCGLGCGGRGRVRPGTNWITF